MNRTRTSNPTIARLDRTAERLGVPLTKHGTNTRSFTYAPSSPFERLIKYRPGGKGVLKVESFVGSTLDAESVVSIERMERLIAGAADR